MAEYVITGQQIPVGHVSGLLSAQEQQHMHMIKLENRQLVLLRILVAQLSGLIILAVGTGALAWLELTRR